MKKEEVVTVVVQLEYLEQKDSKSLAYFTQVGMSLEKPLFVDVSLK